MNQNILGIVCGKNQNDLTLFRELLIFLRVIDAKAMKEVKEEVGVRPIFY